MKPVRSCTVLLPFQEAAPLLVSASRMKKFLKSPTDLQPFLGAAALRASTFLWKKFKSITDKEVMARIFHSIKHLLSSDSSTHIQILTIDMKFARLTK
jgi:hypothetical protein